MKTFLRNLGVRSALALALPLGAWAQQEPIIGVDINRIGVYTGAGALIDLEITYSGSGYTTPPAVSVTGGVGSNAQVSAVVTDGRISALVITNGGVGYDANNLPTITIAPPPASATSAQATAKVRGVGTNFITPFQNESYGEVGVPINITAQAYGTYPVSGYTYTFFINGVTLGNTPAPLPAGVPAQMGWRPPQPGSYLLTVTANDGLHTATSLAVRYFVTGTAIIGPVDNTLVPNGSSVVLQATATPPPSGPNAFVQRMDFYADGVLVGSDNTYPYSYIYTPAPSPTTHVIEARGYDNNGNQISVNGTATRRLHMVSPIGTPPTVRIVNPTNEGSVSAGTNLNIVTDAVASDGFIKNVDFYLNGVLLSSTQKFPFTASWAPQVPGRYQLLAIAFDDKSNAVASAPVVVNVTGAFPTGSIVSPESSGYTIVQGSVLPVTVRAAGPDGGISTLKLIEFLVDGNVSDSLPKLPPGADPSTAPVLTEPFVFNWKSSVAVGTHRLGLRVTGLNGLSIATPEITVNVVANQPPKVAVTAPTASASITMNAATTVSATATDDDGTIETVEFFANGTLIGSATKSPYTISWIPTAAGGFDITAKAIDAGGATTTSAAVTVVVDPPPATGGPTQTLASYSVFRGDYGSATESGRFALAVNRNGRGTFIGYSTSPSGRSYFWSDITINSDGTFTVRNASNEVVLNGQTSATGVAGSFDGKTFIGPVTPANATFTPLMVTGSIPGLQGSQVVAIVGGDGSVTLYSSAGTGREVGSGLLTETTGAYSVASTTGGRFSGMVANAASIVSGAVSGSVEGSFLLRQQPSRISNISTRALAGSGDRTLLAGFIVSGSGSKSLLVRAVGPTLANFGVTNPLADPTLNVLSRTSALLASNNDWGNSAALATLATQVGAFPLTASSRDAALQVSISPGIHTAVVGGAGSATGSALIEIYDTDAVTATTRITNISTRGLVGSGEALIAGFVVSGDVRKKLLIRAVGPTLTKFGITSVLADPRLDVLSGSTSIASNNDWTESSVYPQVNSTTAAVGAFPLNANSKDAAVVLQLTPGAYTVQIGGAGTSSGTVLVEIYDADL